MTSEGSKITNTTRDSAAHHESDGVAGNYGLQENGEMTAPRSPLVVGGVGGSGTRVYRQICELANHKMVTESWFTRLRKLESPPHDNVFLNRFFYGKWVDPYLNGELDEAGIASMTKDLRRWLFLTDPAYANRKHWGWKNPRAIYLLPLVFEQFENTRFLQVVRDGRDHAFHPKFPYRQHELGLLTETERDLPDHLRKALMWSRTTELPRVRAGEWSDRIHVSRLEDLCSNPKQEIAKIYRWLMGAADPAMVDQAAAVVRTPSSLGRWHDEPTEKIAEVSDLIGDELTHFGYER